MRAAILAGGAARRFGGKPKGLCTVGGERVLDRIARLLEDTTGSHPIVIFGSPEQTHLGSGYTTVVDAVPGKGTLGGIHTAITHQPGPVLIAAWDMPFLNRDLLARLRDGFGDSDVFLPASNGRRGMEPLCGVYGPVCSKAIDDQLHSDDLRAIGFHNKVRVALLPLSEVEKCGNPERLFFNINSDDDLKQAEEMWLRLE